jgi:hypothetical protein
MGLADLNKDEIIDYCKRNDIEYDENETDGDFVLDFENHFTMMDTSIEPILKKIITSSEIETLEEKAFLGWFIYTLQLRNHVTFNKTLDTFDLFNRPKFELFLNLKWTLQDADLMMRLVSPILMATWTLYKSKEFKFPICDNPILMYGKSNFYLPISPKLLLKVDLRKPINVNTAPACHHKSLPYFFVYSDFIERTIRSAKREIIFPERQLLERILKKI